MELRHANGAGPNPRLSLSRYAHPLLTWWARPPLCQAALFGGLPLLFMLLPMVVQWLESIQFFAQKCLEAILGRFNTFATTVVNSIEDIPWQA